MAQNQSGLVSYEKGASVFIGNVDTDWSNISQGNQISVVGSNLAYVVANTTSPASSTSGFWELTIEGIIGDADALNAPYGIQMWFTKNLNLPIPDVGDVQYNVFFARALLILDLMGVNVPEFGSWDEGSIPLVANQQDYTITLNKTQSGTAYQPVVTILDNSDGTNVDNVQAMVIERTTTTMRLWVFNPPTNNNYIALWKIGGPSVQSGSISLLLDTTLVADAANYAIATIPQSYNHLLFRVNSRSTRATATQFMLQLNSDATLGNYSQHQILSNGASTLIPSNASIAGMSVGVMNGVDAAANDFAMSEARINFYRSNKFKRSIVSSSYAIGTQASESYMVAEWKNVAAITSGLLVPFNGDCNILAGTRIMLYGVY